MKFIPAILFLTIPLCAQTTAYLRSGPPRAVQVMGADYAANGAWVVHTGAVNNSGVLVPANHGFSSNCGSSVTCYADITGFVVVAHGGACPTATGVGGSAESYGMNGVIEVAYVTANTLGAYDLTGNPIVPTGDWCNGDYTSPYNGPAPRGASWIAQVTPYTVPAGPTGWLDGTNGGLNRKFQCGTQNGCTAFTLNNAVGTCGSGGTCTLTVTTSYDPTQTEPGLGRGLQAGDYITIWGTNTNLDSENPSTCAGAGGSSTVATPYTVASVSSTGYTTTAFSCAGLSAGDYSSSGGATCGGANNDTQTGSQSCVRVSQVAYHGNPPWDALVTIATNNHMLDSSSTNYKYQMDGGSISQWSDAGARMFAAAAFWFMVDQRNTLLFRDAQYIFQNIEAPLGGVTFIENEMINLGGNGDLNQMDPYTATQLTGLVFDAYSPYASSGSVIKFQNKILNDQNNPSNLCDKSHEAIQDGSTNFNVVIGTGTAAAGNATSITLASGTGVMVGEVVMLGSAQACQSTNWPFPACTGAGTCATSGVGAAVCNMAPTTGTWGVITGWNSGTLVATIGAGWQAPTQGSQIVPTAGTLYTVYAGASWSTTSSGALATVTLYGTTTTAAGITVGSALMAGIWNYYPLGLECKVTSLSPLQCYNSYGIPSNATSPTLFWLFQPLTVSSTVTTGGPIAIGDCGLYWAMAHGYGGSYGAQPAVYPASGGGGSIINGGINYMGNQTAGEAVTRLNLDFAMLGTGDPRARNDLAAVQSFAWDYAMPANMSYFASGFGNQGAQYSNWVSSSFGLYAWMLGLNAPGFPDLSGSGPWLGQAQYNMFVTLPDFNSGYAAGGVGGVLSAVPLSWGGGGSQANQLLPDAPTVTGTSIGLQPSMWFAPTSTSAGYVHNWLTNLLASESANLLGHYGLYYEGPLGTLYSDPRVPSVDYRTQPHQYMFKDTNYTQAQALTGWTLPGGATSVKGLAMISRTGFGSAGDTSHYTDTFTMFHDAGVLGNGHFLLGPGLGWIYKTGPLIDIDPPNVGGTGADLGDYSWAGSAVRVGNLGGGYAFTNSDYSTPDVPGQTTLLNWSSANAGSLGANYGDSASRYAHTCVDSAGAYKSAMDVTSAVRCWTDFKHSGWDQFVIDHDEVATSVAEPVQRSIFYAQNGYNTIDGIYTGGITATGSAGQSCILNNFNNGGGSFTATLYLDSTNAIHSGDKLNANGNRNSFFTSAPTSATASNGTATCSGIAAVSTTLQNLSATYATGTTICVNSSGSQVDCGTMASVADGVSPVRIKSTEQSAQGFGVMTAILTPSTVTPHWDCPGTYTSGNQPQCSSTANYALNNLLSGTYTSGVTATGSTGQTCVLTFTNGAAATVALTGTNTISGGTALTITSFGNSFASAPSSATASNGTASCSGTATVSTSIGTYSAWNGNSSPAGWSDKVTIAGGTAAGAAVRSLEDVIVHKIMQSPSDSTLTAAALNPDSAMTGAEACGATSCIAYVRARGAGTVSAIANFTTSLSSSKPYQILLSGLTAGTYTLKLGSTTIYSGTVAAGDNSIYAEVSSGTTDGTISLNNSAPTCSITTSSLPGGTVGVPYSQTLGTANCTAPVTWSVVPGSLPGGLTIGASTGMIGGTPTTATGSPYAFTVQAVDSAPSTTTQALSITISGGIASGSSQIDGQTKLSGNAIIH